MMQRDLIEHVLAASDPTVRAVLAQDSAALARLVISAGGLAVHQLTGSPLLDAAGSILVGVLLAVIGIFLINRNRRFLVGQEAELPRARGCHPGPAGRVGGRRVTLPARSSGQGWSRWSATST